MKILVHVCCAPCFTYPNESLAEKGHDVTAFFYNPNIHPYMEFKSRRTSLEQYAQMKNTKVLYNNEYDLENYLRGALLAADRCRFRYECRLNVTAKTANELGFDAFTTTLLISPFQKHEMLADVGKKAADEHGVEFYYEDFRVGYRKSREISKDTGLYMQKYCGCIFSEKERYLKPATNKSNPVGPV